MKKYDEKPEDAMNDLDEIADDVIRQLMFCCSDGLILQELQAKIKNIVTTVAMGHVGFKFSTIVRRILMAFFKKEYIMTVNIRDEPSTTHNSTHFFGKNLILGESYPKKRVTENDDGRF